MGQDLAQKAKAQEETQTQEGFKEEVISSARKKRTISRSFGFFMFNDCYYECKNCGSKRIGLHYTLKKVRRTPDPVIFGRNASPSIHKQEEDHSYFCKSCGIENPALEKLANGPNYRDTGIGDGCGD